MLSEDGFKNAMGEMFEVDMATAAASLFDGLRGMTVKTYYSAGSTTEKGVVFSDISALDVFSENVNMSEWGGLSSFASKVSEIVSCYGE